jgi:hypothetical protein
VSGTKDDRYFPEIVSRNTKAYTSPGYSYDWHRRIIVDTKMIAALRSQKDEKIPIAVAEDADPE